MADDNLNSADRRNQFRAEILEKSIIAVPLLELMEKHPEESVQVIIDLNFNYPGGCQLAAEKVLGMLTQLDAQDSQPEINDTTINTLKNKLSRQYVFVRLPVYKLRQLIREDRKAAPRKDVHKDQKGETALSPAIYKVWPDFEIQAQMIESVRTIKADAAHLSFSALGDGITWAVIDSGIDFSHPHFSTYQNKNKYHHIDFTGSNEPFADQFGHGTHVAGIIAGEMVSKARKTSPYVLSKMKDADGLPVPTSTPVEKISGIAPKCSLVSIKVLDALGKGQTSSLISAIAYIQQINNYGRDLKIHGVNLSLGYSFDPEWFACGQSPLCVEVNRLVKSGVVVVVAAGNTGYGFSDSKFNGRMATGMSLSINDPGNAELAITVGSTHREMPHTYGVSYFSSKGPTGDGRAKPDLIAPGEKIISCAAGSKKAAYGDEASGSLKAFYLEESGTSMATPHVSGAIAAFLSIRKEYIGQPEKVKQIFCDSATDLKRDANFQGKGLVDLMRAIQSV
jgi:serine protease AprX